MTHIAHPTSTVRTRRAAPARGSLRRWLTRHLVAMDPSPAPGRLDVLDGHRGSDAARPSLRTSTVPST